MNHHDAAYAWAERHSAVVGDDGQLMAVLDVGVERSEGPMATSPTAPIAGAARFSNLPQAIAAMLGSIEDEDELLEAIGSLAPELQEAALTGASLALEPGQAPSDIVVVTDDTTLQAALAMPAAAWRLFLHPKQRHRHLAWDAIERRRAIPSAVLSESRGDVAQDGAQGGS